MDISRGVEGFSGDEKTFEEQKLTGELSKNSRTTTTLLSIETFEFKRR